MAIAGFLVQAKKSDLPEVEAQLQALPELTIYGAHQDQFIVVVAEAPAEQMEDVLARINRMSGVIATYTAYVTVEDELPGVAD